VNILSYLLAVLAACANATSSVLQRKANRRVPEKENLRLRLIWSLFHQPVWFGGVLAIIAGFLLQATALSGGELAVVEPVLVLELPATLILASWVFRARLRWREWSTTAAMAAGLAGLMFFLAPSGGRSAPSGWYVWVAGILMNLAVVGALVVWAHHRGQGGSAGGRRRAARAGVLGAAAGAQFGLTATLMKGVTGSFSQGLGALFSSWQLYGMVASGLLGMFLLQSAMNAGRLIAAQPAITLSDPVVSVLWGVLAFGEKVRGGWFAVAAAVCALVIATAVLVLARSPLLEADSGRTAGDRQHSTKRHTGEERPGQGSRPSAVGQ
jgi:drug/metabolite transporter (DMT)-like permease